MWHWATSLRVGDVRAQPAAHYARSKRQLNHAIEKTLNAPLLRVIASENDVLDIFQSMHQIVHLALEISRWDVDTARNVTALIDNTASTIQYVSSQETRKRRI